MALTDDERAWYRNFPSTTACAVWQGGLLEITYVKQQKEFRMPGRRRTVSGFSPAARLRMLRTVATVQWERVKASLFITLTYPDSVCRRTSDERNRDRYQFLRSMERYLGKEVGALWRIEWQKRKSGALKGTTVPHVHLIVFGIGYIPYQKIREWWRAVLHVDGALATDVQKIKGGKMVARYVSKYCAKLPEERSLDNASYVNTHGRHWGIHRKDKIPFSERWVIPCLTKQDIQLAENAGCQVFRYFTREAGQGFSLLGDLAEKVGEELFLRMIDKESKLP